MASPRLRKATLTIEVKPFLVDTMNTLIESRILANAYSISDLEISLRAGDDRCFNKKFFKNIYALPVLKKYGIFPNQKQLNKYYCKSNCVYQVDWEVWEYRAGCARHGELYDFWKRAGYTESAAARNVVLLAKDALSNKKQRIS